MIVINILLAAIILILSGISGYLRDIERDLRALHRDYATKAYDSPAADDNQKTAADVAWDRIVNGAIE